MRPLQRLLSTALVIGVLSTPAAILAQASGSPARQQAGGTLDQEAGVRAALQHYLNGHATGSADEMRQAFHPDARMTFVREGKVVVTPIAEYIARFTGQTAPDEAQRKRRITNVQVTGTAAIGRIELDYPNAHIVDYMTLLKDGDRWVIIAKSFYTEPKGR
jgi:hypothetical protein